MKLTQELFDKIARYLPKQRGNVEIENFRFIEAILYLLENGCKWRALPKEYGKWNSVYMRMKRWARNGVLEKVFMSLQEDGTIKINGDFLCIDSTTVKVHPDATGALKKIINNK